MIIISASKERNVNVGASSFLRCFYSTICSYVESSDVSHAIKLLKYNQLASDECLKAAKEFNIIRDILSQKAPESVVWDIDEPNATPPWGNNISPVITSLGNYFITADGKDLIYEIIALLQYASEIGQDVVVSD